MILDSNAIDCNCYIFTKLSRQADNYQAVIRQSKANYLTQNLKKYIRRYQKKFLKNPLLLRELNLGLLGERQVSYPLDHPALVIKFMTFLF